MQCGETEPRVRWPLIDKCLLALVDRIAAEGAERPHVDRRATWKATSLLGDELRSQKNCDARRLKAHTLKGAARAVGAFTLADYASKIEIEPEKQAPVRALLREVETVRDYIASLLR